MKQIKGQFNQGKGQKYAVVHGRFNSFIVESMKDGALDVLTRYGVDDKDITTVEVPGAFELPLVCDKLAASGKFDAVIALGCVIRGSTTHYDYVCNEAAKGIAAMNTKHGLPVIFGVITTENIEQAIDRAGTKVGNKGAEAAMSAIEMVNLLQQLP